MATLTAGASASTALPVRDYSSPKPQADTAVPAQAGNVNLALDQGHILLGSVNRGLSIHRPGNVWEELKCCGCSNVLTPEQGALGLPQLFLRRTGNKLHWYAGTSESVSLWGCKNET